MTKMSGGWPDTHRFTPKQAAERRRTYDYEFGMDDENLDRLRLVVEMHLREFEAERDRLAAAEGGQKKSMPRLMLESGIGTIVRGFDDDLPVLVALGMREAATGLAHIRNRAWRADDVRVTALVARQSRRRGGTKSGKTRRNRGEDWLKLENDWREKNPGQTMSRFHRMMAQQELGKGAKADVVKHYARNTIGPAVRRARKRGAK